MSALFEQGFFVRKPAWHGLGVVLPDYPGRDEAFILAGHDYRVVEFENGDVLTPLTEEEFAAMKQDRSMNVVRYKGVWCRFGHRDSAKGLRIEQVRADGTIGPLHKNELPVQSSTYTVIQNEVGWDILDALLDGNYNGKTLNYETGATLDGGAECFVTAWLDEPIQVVGDDSPIFPYVYANWRHDGAGALNVGSTNVRIVCANTVAAARTQAERTGTAFTFKHTKNVMERIEEAKEAIRGITGQNAALKELADELATIHLTAKQVEDFVIRFTTPPEATTAMTSDRVRKHVQEAQSALRGILNGPTIPEAHQATGWGLFNAGCEYLDHVRAYRSNESYVRRTLLTHNKLKDTHLLPSIYEAAGVPR